MRTGCTCGAGRSYTREAPRANARQPPQHCRYALRPHIPFGRPWRGRKRGLGTVLATQRLSKLHKDAAAEATNVLVGRTTLDVDVATARDLLRLSKQDGQKLRTMHPGQ